MARTEVVTITNMCMIYDGSKVLVQEKIDDDYCGITFPGGHVEKGESVAISASGWSDFSWSISNPSIGSLDKYTGSRVVYTSRAASGTQVVTVVARGTSATATTNSTNNVSAPSQYSRTIENYHGAEEDISSEYSEDSSTSTIDPSIPEK